MNPWEICDSSMCFINVPRECSLYFRKPVSRNSRVLHRLEHRMLAPNVIMLITSQFSFLLSVSVEIPWNEKRKNSRRSI